ncbi:hypothetical protein Q3G72_010677 [Acer saccharum]|nr:hypothetical protein Q3G72_010677 [Acer saccharum]
MHCDKSRKKAMTIAVQTSGVISATIKGDDKGQIEVTGVAIDIYNLLTKLRKKLKYADLLSVAPIEEKPPDEPITTAETPQPPPQPQPQPQPVGVRLPDYYVCEVINDHCNYRSDCPIM